MCYYKTGPVAILERLLTNSSKILKNDAIILMEEILIKHVGFFGTFSARMEPVGAEYSDKRQVSQSPIRVLEISSNSHL